MTRLLMSPVDQDAPARGRGAVRRWAPYVLIAVIAFLARLVPTLRGGGLLGLGTYDDGVYYAGAASLVAGRVPYADFVLLHPPGIALVLAPFAALGRWVTDPTAYAVARLVFMALGALNAVLVALLARRFGRVAAVVSGVLYALWYPAAYWEARTTIEPIGTMLVLLCLLLLLPRVGQPSRRATVLAGVLLGLSFGLKIWAVAPIAVIVLWQLVVAGWRPAARVVAGVAAGAAVIWVPFLVMAPGPMLRMVVADQLGRPQMTVTTAERLESMLNLQPHLDHVSAGLRHAVLAVGLVLVLGAAAAAWSRRSARVVVLLLGVTAAVVLVGPSYFLHYATFPAPFLAVVVGVAVAVVLARVPRPVAVGGAAAVLVVIVLAAVTPLSTPLNTPFPGARLGRLALGKGCVIADDPSALILMNALTRDLARGCPQPVDFTGSTYDVARERRADGSPVPRRANRTWQRLATQQLTAGSATILVRLQGDGFNAATLRRLQALPVIGDVDGYVLRGR